MRSPEPVHRDDDGELIGLLKGNAAGLFSPCTLFGYPLTEATAHETATEYLTNYGLSYLAQSWEFRDGDQWLTAQIIEATPSAVIVRLIDYGSPDTYGSLRTLHPPSIEHIRLRR
ncbi:MAG: hypothetical protein U5O16_16765 [Rhodococcus sp. (in: high G+C Gram-positive bacteria)]|uniref:hypothetical protein n=1 Tax=Rhodococcus sp. TaxID=1831 RepID=UPI002AD817ED|nr:hypothetical protein [Rhodococcus sp. (in: high G+C Gram-positive bacteria)]